MRFLEMLDVAERKAGGQNALARALGANHNAPRQWRLRLGLPSTPEKIVKLAELAGVTPQEMEEAIWNERRSRWDSRRRGGPHLALRKPLNRATLPPRLMRARQAAAR